MPDQLDDFPFWALHFDSDGKLTQPTVASLAREIGNAGITDLFVFSHGWNNDQSQAMQLYGAFFGEVRKIVDDPSVPKRPGAVIGVAGVLWPSILFPGDTGLPQKGGGAASFGPGEQSTLASELPKVFDKPEQQAPLENILALLKDRSPDHQALLQFRDELNRLFTAQGVENTTTETQDDLERRAATVQSDEEWLGMLDAFSVQPSAANVDEGGGPSDFSSLFGRLWNGAKNVLRVGTFWQMKNRAGVVGKSGLGTLINDLHGSIPALRLHLIGHSFGARLVSCALAGLPDATSGGESPVKSLFLIQGAFSHFAFAEALPFDKSRKGDLAGMASRVDGPLLTTYSLKDLAVGNAYPAAAVIGRQDAAAATDLLYRWEGMGHDGAQCVDAQDTLLGELKSVYSFEKGKWINLDGNQVIVAGGPPSGAHGDIVHPEIAWAALAASKIAS